MASLSLDEPMSKQFVHVPADSGSESGPLIVVLADHGVRVDAW